MSVAWLAGTTLRLSVPLYLSTVLLGLLPTSVAMLGLMPLAGDRPWRADLLAPGWLNVIAELLMSAAYTRESPQVALLLAAALLVLPLALLLQVVAYSFLAGGILEALRAGPAGRAPFWPSCRRWFWPFLRLSLLGGILALFAAVLVAAVSSFGRVALGPDLAAILQFALQAIVLGWLELTRAVMVTEGKRSVGTAMRRAGRLALRPPVPLLWLLIALPGAGLLVAALVPPSFEDPYAVGSLVKAVAFGQVVALAGAWTKVVRLAVASRLALTLASPPAGAASDAPTGAEPGSTNGSTPPLRAGEGAGG